METSIPSSSRNSTRRFSSIVDPATLLTSDLVELLQVNCMTEVVKQELDTTLYLQNDVGIAQMYYKYSSKNTILVKINNSLLDNGSAGIY